MVVCDQCNTEKPPSNGWFILRQHAKKLNKKIKSPIGTKIWIAPSGTPQREDSARHCYITIHEWRDSMANVVGSKHICCHDCLQKQIATITSGWSETRRIRQ